MRRWSVVIVTLVGVVGLAVVSLFTGWAFQPFLGTLERKIAEGTPYEVAIGTARLGFGGNLIVTSLDFGSERTLLARFPEIEIDIDWHKLLKKQVVIQGITIVKPRVELASLLSGLPKSGNKPISPEGISKWIGQLKVVDGQLVLTEKSGSTVKSLMFNLACAAEGHDLAFQNIEIFFPKGNVSGKGTLSLVDNEFSFSGNSNAFPIDDVVRLFAKVPDKTEVKHTGVWRVVGSPRKWTTKSSGQLAIVSPKLKASPFVDLQASGDKKRIELTTTVRDPKLKGMARIHYDVDKKWLVASSSANLKLELPTKWDPTEARVSWSGTPDAGQLKFLVKTSSASVESAGRAEKKGSGISYTWDFVKAVDPTGRSWTLAGGGTVESRDGGIFARDVRIVERGRTLEVENLNYKDKIIFVRAHTDGFPIEIASSPQDHREPVKFSLSGQLQLEGSLEAPTGHFNLTASSGSVGKLAFRADAQGTIASSAIKIEKSQIRGTQVEAPVLITGTIPWAWIVKSAPKVPLDIAVNAGPLDPAPLLKELGKMHVAAGGIFKFEGNVNDRTGRIKMQGKLIVILPSFEHPELGLKARNLELALHVDNESIKVHRGHVQLGKGHLDLTGTSKLPALNFDLVGQRATMEVKNLFELEADTHLSLRGTFDSPYLFGQIKLREGTIEKKESKKKKGEPKVVSKDKPAASDRYWIPLKLNIAANWDKNVWYREGLTKVETQADLKILKEKGDSKLAIKGQVNVLRGSYDAMGRDFVIKSGSLIFTGETELNPIISFHATHQMRDALVELDASGTIREPELHFRSTPPMPEQDILSMLALGRSPSQATTGGADSSIAPGADLAADLLSSYITRQARQTGMNILDLDVIRVSPAEKGNNWTFGRYVGSKLFVSYSQNTEDTGSQAFNAEYTVTPRWTLVGQSGSQTDSYLDLNFRIPLRQRRRTE